MGESLRKKPLSLNERHTRLLQSASHSKPCDDGEEQKPSKVKVFGCRRLCKAVDDVEDDVPQFSGIVDFDSSPVGVMETKQKKVKLGGRRRLCKVSSTCNDHGQTNVEHQFQDISDFSSPAPAINVSNNDPDGDGVSEIRDIWNDLSSKLELLSIEKKRNPQPIDKKVVSLDDSAGIVSDVIVEQKRVEGAEFASAGSSFSRSSGTSGLSSDVCDQPRGDGGMKDFDNAASSESEGDNFYGGAKMGNNIEVKAKKEKAKVACKPDINHSRLVSKVEDEDDDDDCIIVERVKSSRANERHGHVLEEECDDSSGVEVLDDYDDEIVSESKKEIALSGPTSTYKLPGKIWTMLYPHQWDGLKWLWSLHYQGKGGILGDDMGLGKTMQISGFLAGLFHSHLIKRAMIVAPKTLIPHWIKELSVVGLSNKTREYFGTSLTIRQYELQYVLQDKGVLLTTYDIVRNNFKQLRGNSFFDDESSEDGPIWDYMILDEGHLIKNPTTQRAKSLLEIPCAHRIVISGTPIQNNLKELWALFNFCCPDLLGDKKWFKDRYEHPILRGNDKCASARDKHVGSTVAKELRERIQPYFLRRLKNEVFSEDGAGKSGKLSKKNEVIVWLKLTSCQRHLYEAFLNSELVLSAFDGTCALATITILKKICDHPYLLTKRAAEDVLEGMDSMLNQEDRDLAEKLATHAVNLTEEDEFQKHDNVSCKISFIISLLENLLPEGHNVLIFSQTRKMLNLIQDSLQSNGFEFMRIDGTTKASDRVKIVDDFQQGHGAPIFLLTSQVGGLGLTLTRADRVIVVDPAWNPSTDNQSVDRAYRIGQKKDVVVYRLMTCGTIEEKIYRMQIFKGGLFKTATEHKEQTRYFSKHDLCELLSLPKAGFDVSPTQQQLHQEHVHQISMTDSLKAHIKFLESLDIGGVSHHSLLYTKTEPTPVMPEEEDSTLNKRPTSFGNFSRSLPKRNVDGAQFAFNPKDLPLSRKNSSPLSPAAATESEIKDRINRLSQILSNKATVLKLPDKGEKIRKQIMELNMELETVSKATSKISEVIALDELADQLHSSLNV